MHVCVCVYVCVCVAVLFIHAAICVPLHINKHTPLSPCGIIIIIVLQSDVYFVCLPDRTHAVLVSDWLPQITPVRCPGSLLP